jgi:hypothetical protein
VILFVLIVLDESESTRDISKKREHAFSFDMIMR